MAIILKVVCAFLAVISIVSAVTPVVPIKKCTKPNQVWTLTGNHGCQNTCEYPTRSSACSYSAGSYPGCICKDGYLKNKNGVCILSKLCNEAICAKLPNEEYSECDNTPCQNTCAYPNLINSCTSELECYRGCICKEDYLRNDDGVCVLKEDCSPEKCLDPNEKWYGCKPCKYTCESPDISCGSWCIPGCECKEGYTRKNDLNDTCVPKEACPTCDEGEEYDSCGTPCPTTCDNKDGPFPPCATFCVEGCFCKPGLVRNTRNGFCIPPEDCPPKCPLYEEYVQCGTPCPLTCKNKDNPPNPKDCPKKCVPGCFCIKGYVRNEDTGKCVLPKNCPKPKCGQYEIWSTNCPIAPETCDFPENLKKGTKAACCCAKPNYVRSVTGGKCVHRNTCA